METAQEFVASARAQLAGAALQQAGPTPAGQLQRAVLTCSQSEAAAVCAGCGEQAAAGLRRCSGCRQVQYCRCVVGGWEAWSIAWW